MLSVFYAECYLCWVSQIIPLFWVSLCRMSFKLGVANNPFILGVIMQNVIMLNVIMLNVIMLNVIMLNVIMLNVIMLNVIMLNVVAPPKVNQSAKL